MSEKLDKLDQYVMGNAGNAHSSEFIKHALHPENAGSLPGADACATLEGHDGNSMEIWLKLDGENITDARFWTDGCSNLIACGSVMTCMLKGKTIYEALCINDRDISDALNGLQGDGCTCASLTCNTLKAAIRNFCDHRRDPWKRRYMHPR